MFSRTELMHDAWHDLLSCATFSQHKHADVGGRNLRRHGQRTVKCAHARPPQIVVSAPHPWSERCGFVSDLSINVTGVQSKVFIDILPGLQPPLGNTTTVLWVVRQKMIVSLFACAFNQNTLHLPTRACVRSFRAPFDGR